MVRALAISDVLLDALYSPWILTRFADVNIILGCGDLPYYYLEYVLTTLNRPLYYVRGNHAYLVEHTIQGPKTHPHGAVDLHRRIVRRGGLILAGVEGSLRYRPGAYQYTQQEMWLHILRLIPGLLWNKAAYGRYLDVFVTHAPPWGIHDQPDRPHQGIKAFRWILDVIRPAFHFHGHIHVYRQDTEKITKYKETTVINAYGFIEAMIAPAQKSFAPFGFLTRRVNP